MSELFFVSLVLPVEKPGIKKVVGYCLVKADALAHILIFNTFKQHIFFLQNSIFISAVYVGKCVMWYNLFTPKVKTMAFISHELYTAPKASLQRT